MGQQNIRITEEREKFLNEYMGQHRELSKNDIFCLALRALEEKDELSYLREKLVELAMVRGEMK